MKSAPDSHFQKDIEYHEKIGSEYHDVVVNPRSYLNAILFAPIDKAVTGGDKMLDLGCGTGHMMLRYGPRYRSVIGVDHSPRMLESARENCRKSGIEADFINGNLFDFLAGDPTGFDLVTCVGCLHHLLPESIPDVFEGIARALKPGGVAVLAEPIVVESESEPAAIQAWNRKAVRKIPQYSVDAEEPDEAPIDSRILFDSLARSGLDVTVTSRSWEILPHNLPPSLKDRLMISYYHRRYGSSGVVLAIAARKSG